MPVHLFASSGLSYLQGLNQQDTSKSFLRSIDVMLRYPGLCRYKPWWVRLVLGFSFVSNAVLQVVA